MIIVGLLLEVYCFIKLKYVAIRDVVLGGNPLVNSMEDFGGSVPLLNAKSFIIFPSVSLLC